MRKFGFLALGSVMTAIGYAQLVAPVQTFSTDLGLPTERWRKGTFEANGTAWVTSSTSTLDGGYLARLAPDNTFWNLDFGRGLIRVAQRGDGFAYTISKQNLSNQWRIRKISSAGTIVNEFVYASTSVNTFVTEIVVTSDRVIAAGIEDGKATALTFNHSLGLVNTLSRPGAYDIGVCKVGEVGYVLTREPRSVSQSYFRKYSAAGAFVGQVITICKVDPSLKGRHETWATDSLGHHYLWVQDQLYRFGQDMTFIWQKSTPITAVPFELEEPSYSKVTSWGGLVTGGASPTSPFNGIRLRIDPAGFAFGGIGNTGNDQTVSRVEIDERNPFIRQDIFEVRQPTSLFPFRIFSEKGSISGWSTDTGTWPSHLGGLVGQDPQGRLYVGTEDATNLLIRMQEVPRSFTENYATNTATSLTVNAANGVLANDLHASEAILVSGTASGTLTLSLDGGFTYFPGASFTGEDSFVYRAQTGALMGSNVIVNLRVGPNLVKSVSLTTPHMVGQQDARVTVQLTSPAPTGGLVVVPTYLGTGASFSPSGTWKVPAGLTSANFTAKVAPNLYMSNGAIHVAPSGTFYGPSAQFTVLKPRPTSITFPASIASGSVNTATVRLNGPAGPSPVYLKISSAGGLLHDTTVVVPVGSSTATFQVTAPSVSGPVTGKLRAAGNGFMFLRGVTIVP